MTTLILLAALVSLLVVLAGLQVALSALDRRRFPRRGTRVPVMGEEPNILEVGQEDRGNPVVFLAGLGSSVLAFAWIMRIVAKEARVVAFDRPGLGWSGRARGDLDALTSAKILAATLDAIGVRTPVILVAHSYGGVVARVFAATFPHCVAGLVLLDSAHEDQLERFPSLVGFVAKLMMFQNSIMKWRARLALMRVPGALRGQGYGLPDDVQREFYALLATTQHRTAAAREAAAWPASRIAARQSRDFGHLPLVALVADQWPKAMLPTWFELQNEIASWSSAGQVRIVEGANHVTIAMSETFAPVVAEVILEMREAYGTSERSLGQLSSPASDRRVVIG